MTPNVLTSFAVFMRDHGYTTRMWENGYTAALANDVCHAMTEWFQTTFQSSGEFVVLWSNGDGVSFSGDSELVYLEDGIAYLVPNPYIEGDSEGFVTALMKIVHGYKVELYQTEVQNRVLYNAW